MMCVRVKDSGVCVCVCVCGVYCTWSTCACPVQLSSLCMRHTGYRLSCEIKAGCVTLNNISNTGRKIATESTTSHQDKLRCTFIIPGQNIMLAQQQGTGPL